MCSEWPPALGSADHMKGCFLFTFHVLCTLFPLSKAPDNRLASGVVLDQIMKDGGRCTLPLLLGRVLRKHTCKEKKDRSRNGQREEMSYKSGNNRGFCVPRVGARAGVAVKRYPKF